MSWWAVGTAAVSLVGGVVGSKAAGKAADAEKQSAQASIDEQRRQYNTTRADFAPYRKTGYQALDRLNQLTLGGPGGPDYSAFFRSPGYNFARDEGTRGVNQSYAGRGGGNAMKALDRFNVGLANQGFSDYWNRVKGVSDMGLGATGQVAGYGAQASSNIGNSLMAQGDAQAAGDIGSANSLTAGINSGLNNYLLYRGGYYGKPSTSGGGSANSWERSFS